MQRHYSSQPKQKERDPAIAINTLDFLQLLSFPSLGETANQHEPGGLNAGYALLSCQPLTFFSSLINAERIALCCHLNGCFFPRGWFILLYS